MLEDIDAKPYQIDRMITQLKQAGKFASVRGVVFGEMLQCVQHANQGYRLEEVLVDLLSGVQRADSLRFSRQVIHRGQTSSCLLACEPGSPGRSVFDSSCLKRRCHEDLSHRNLWNGDGGVGGNASGKAVHGLRLGYGCLSADVRLSG